MSEDRIELLMKDVIAERPNESFGEHTKLLFRNVLNLTAEEGDVQVFIDFLRYCMRRSDKLEEDNPRISEHLKRSLNLAIKTIHAAEQAKSSGVSQKEIKRTLQSLRILDDSSEEDE